MSTQARIDASRANGAKSHGPVTPEGKAISSQNAVVHGLRADPMNKTATIKGEDPALFDAMRNRMLLEYQPGTDTELILIEKMAMAWWRHLRIFGLEDAGYAWEIARQETDHPEIAAQEWDIRAYFALTGRTSETGLQVLRRYESTYERQYERALRLLRESQKFRMAKKDKE